MVARAYAPNATVVYDTVDLHWIRMSRAAEQAGDLKASQEAERYRKLERATAVASDLVLAITEQERSLLIGEAPGARVAVVPNIHSPRAQGPGPEARQGLFFIGGFEHRPNVDAMLWFVHEVLPRIRLEIDDVVLHVVGSKAPRAVLALESAHVKVAGYVPDPDPFFDGSRVFVSPLRYGAGMKGKIGQAMTYGLPVVTTSIGSEGMRLVDGVNALIADDPASFAAAVIRVYRDLALWTRLSENSRRHVEANFSEAAARPLLAELFALGPAPSGTGRLGHVHAVKA
jgi:glycosyltransferase involved in cell wall biosynthesis